jgi:hypothetical protein
MSVKRQIGCQIWTNRTHDTEQPYLLTIAYHVLVPPTILTKDMPNKQKCLAHGKQY